MSEYILPEDHTLMILDDDTPFRTRLGRAMEQRGFKVTTVETIFDAKREVRDNPPAFAVLDMRLEDGNGLDVVDQLHEARPDCKISSTTPHHCDPSMTVLLFFFLLA